MTPVGSRGRQGEIMAVLTIGTHRHVALNKTIGHESCHILPFWSGLMLGTAICATSSKPCTQRATRCTPASVTFINKVDPTL
jgi:hypothetical protein